jgi:hypothetical protein
MMGKKAKAKIEKVKKSGFGLFRGMGKFTKKDELDTELPKNLGQKL